MEDQLDALILQGQRNNEETNGLLEALIVQNKNNNTQPEIEALIVQNKNLTKTVKSGRDKIVEAVKELKTEPVKELSISNPEDISKAVVERLSEFESTIKEYFAQKLAVEKEKDSKRSKHTADKEKSLGELKTAIIYAIQNLAENIPENNDYFSQFEAILTELKKDRTVDVIKKLEELKNSISGNGFPEELTEYNRVKVLLSNKQIKELGSSMSVSIAGGSFPEKSQNDLYNVRLNQTNREQYSRIVDSWGDNIGSTMVDELMVAERNRVSGGVFNGTTPDTNFYTTVVNANATATISNSILNLKTTSDSDSSVLVYANAIGRYIGGNTSHLRGIIRVLDFYAEKSIRQFGVTQDSTLDNSIYFQVEDGLLSIVAKTKGLVDIKVDNGNFNGEQATYTPTGQFVTIEILYTNRRIDFYLGGHLVHSLVETTDPICGTRHLRPFTKNTNKGVGSPVEFYIQEFTLFTWGNNKTQPKYQYHAGTTTGLLYKTGIGSLHEIVISGVTNNAQVVLRDGIDATGSIIWDSGAMSNQTIPLQIEFNSGLQFSNGLYIVKSGANCNTLTIYE